MEQDGWQRSAAAGGLVFVVLNAAVGFVSGEPPAIGAPVAEVSAHFSQHAGAVEAGVWLFGLAAVALIWWFSALCPWMVRAEDGVARLAAASLLGLAIAGALSFASAAVWASAALQADDATAGALNALGWVLQAAAGFGLAAHLLATSALGWRAGALPVWLAAAGLLSAVAFVIAGILGSTSTGGAGDAPSLVAYLLFSVWVLGVSWVLWRGSRPAAHRGAAQPTVTGLS